MQDEISARSSMKKTATYTVAPFAAIRVPRIQPGAASTLERDFYEMFGYQAFVLANRDGKIFTFACPADWDNDKCFDEFKRLTAAGEETDPVGQPVLMLNPLTFETLHNGDRGHYDGLYDALGIQYAVVVRDRNSPDSQERYAVVHSHFRQIARAIEQQVAEISQIGQDFEPAKAPCLRAERIRSCGERLALPTTVKFVEVYESEFPNIVNKLAQLAGAKYVELSIDYRHGPALNSRKVVYVLDGLGLTAEERAKLYFDRVMVTEAASNGRTIELITAEAEPTELADYYDHMPNPAVLDAAEKSGAEYFEVTVEYRLGGVVYTKVIYVLENEDRSGQERVKAYRDGPLTQEISKRAGHPVKLKSNAIKGKAGHLKVVPWRDLSDE